MSYKPHDVKVSTWINSIPDRIADIILTSIELGAKEFGGPLSSSEKRLVKSAEDLAQRQPNADDIAHVRRSILRQRDPLGQLWRETLSNEDRKSLGAFYTPQFIVKPMVKWVLSKNPDRVIDAGCGSGRFAVEVVRRRPEIEIVAIDIDPVAALICRAHLAQVGAMNAHVIHGDYTKANLKSISKRTAFVGNPPYVRHHSLHPEQKIWIQKVVRRLGYEISQLAGLHAYFFVATALYANPQDIGAFVTSAEWLDTNYGKAVRKIIINSLGLTSLHLLDPKMAVFDDAMTTALITCFEVGVSSSKIRLQKISEKSELNDLAHGGKHVQRRTLMKAPRWSSLFRERSHQVFEEEMMPLGKIARVHRGIATGSNRFFVLTREEARRLSLEPYCKLVLVSAKEILEAKGVVRDGPKRNLLLSPPEDLDLENMPQPLRNYIRQGEEEGVAQRYICSHRTPWWRIGVKKFPPIVATYMARQPPAFAYNPDKLAILNVLHGVYPKKKLTEDEYIELVEYLNSNRWNFHGRGRVYQGGLEKFEPSEMENLPIPKKFLSWVKP